MSRIFTSWNLISGLQERLLATLSAIMSVVGTLIAMVGLYGQISFSVLQRTREIGIRIAVGAEPRQILLMVLRRAFVLVGIGIFIGLPLAFGSLRVAASVLYGVIPSDAMTATGAVMLLTVVGVSAGLVPTRPRPGRILATRCDRSSLPSGD